MGPNDYYGSEFVNRVAESVGVTKEDLAMMRTTRLRGHITAQRRRMVYALRHTVAPHGRVMSFPEIAMALGRSPGGHSTMIEAYRAEAGAVSNKPVAG